MKENQIEHEKYCYFQFKYKCDIEQEEEIRLVGNHENLGQWDPYHAILLYNSKKEGIWKTKGFIQIPIGYDLEYKFLIFKNGSLLRWENLPYNKLHNTNRTIRIVDEEKYILINEQDNLNTILQLAGSSDEEEELNGFIKIKGDKNDKKIPINVLDYESEDNEENTQNNNNANKYKPPSFNNNLKSNINNDDEILICSFYLPVNPKKQEDGSFIFDITNDQFYHTLYTLIGNEKNIKWFGSLKNANNFTEKELKKIKEELIKINLFLFDIDKEVYRKAKIAIEEIFEPLFHYIAFDLSIIENYDSINDYWESYKVYNKIVSDTLRKFITKKSIIYLHDFHFFLVPEILYEEYKKKRENEQLQNLSIGLFSHSPFPSFDVFKRIPFRDDIIKSLIKCRVLGFHTFDDSRNFLKSSKRLLNINYVSNLSGDLAANYMDHTVLLRVKNVSPEISLLKEIAASDEFKKFQEEITKKHSEKKQIFVSVDHFKFLIAIRNKIEGYKKFLEDLKEKSQKNVLLLYIRYSDDELDKDGNLVMDNSQKKTLENIDNLVNEIKKTFGEGSIELYKGKVSFTHRLALFASGNCFLRTCKQESYSLGLYEFLILKQLLGKRDEVVAYIMSELSGVNTSLGGTIKVNPFDSNSIKKGFSDASQRLSEEGVNKQHYLNVLDKDYQHVMKSSFLNWFYSFLIDIKNTKLSDENTLYMGVNERLNFTLLKVAKNFRKLNIEEISKDYNRAYKRLLFFDYEGTLPSTYSNINNNEIVSKGSRPTDTILDLLSDLTADKRNIVFIVAGKGPYELKKWFNSVNNLGLAAEHGFKYCVNSKKNEEDEHGYIYCLKNHLKDQHKEDEDNDDINWTKMIKQKKSDWIKNCIENMEPYVERCEGSFLDQKESSIVWQYTDCDQEIGKSFASAITSELTNLIEREDKRDEKDKLHITYGKGFLEVSFHGVGKGYFVSHILKILAKKKRIPDFILCVGDDKSDEKMFHYLSDKKSQIREINKHAKLYSITVGKKPSKAKYYVENTKDVENILKRFSNNSKMLAGSISSMNLREKKFNDKYEINEDDEIDNHANDNTSDIRDDY